jgi:hypothetical protein
LPLKALKVHLEGFFIALVEKEVIMLGRIKRSLIRAKLKKEKLKLVAEIMTINRKLKILDGIDGIKKEK